MPLDLESSPHSKVYAEIVRTLREDPTLERVIKSWTVYDGNPTDIQEPSIAQCPNLLIRPAQGSERFYGPQGMMGPLYVDVELAVGGTDAILAMDLYYAVKLALYPRDATLRQAIHQALVVAGAEAHYVLQFTQGRYTVRAAGEQGSLFIAQGQIQVNVTSEYNP